MIHCHFLLEPEMVRRSYLLPIWAIFFYSITSVFFGGGTPSLAHPSTIERVLESLSRHASLADSAEVTIEVNPTPVGMSRLEEFHRAGVNRFSIGVQVMAISYSLSINSSINIS